MATVRAGTCISERLCTNAETPVLIEIDRFWRKRSPHICSSRAVK